MRTRVIGLLVALTTIGGYAVYGQDNTVDGQVDDVPEWLHGFWMEETEHPRLWAFGPDMATVLTANHRLPVDELPYVLDQVAADGTYMLAFGATADMAFLYAFRRVRDELVELLQYSAATEKWEAAGYLMGWAE